MKPTANRALAIVRVSTAEQAREERYSIPHQRTHISEECRHRDLDLVHFFEFVQSGAKVLSGSSKERAEVLNFISDYNINIVIVHELDRLARSMLDTLLFVDQLNKLGVAFISIHDGFDTSTAQGQLQMHILSAFSEYFRKQLASKVIGGMVERAKQGKHMGRRPLGYTVGSDGFMIDQQEARTIKMIYGMYLDQNFGLRAIADHLNGMGLKGIKGDLWSHNTIKDILENEVYTGTFLWSDIRVENNHTAIIDRETWEKVQLRRRRKKDLGGRSQNSFYLLSGLLRCGVCNDGTMVGRSARKGKYSYRYYTCNNYASKGTNACPAKYVRADEIENVVMEDIKELISQERPDMKHEIIPSNVDILREELSLKEKELDRLKVMIIRAAEAYERGDYDLDFFSQRKESIANTKLELKKDIVRLKSTIRGQLSPEELNKRLKIRTENAKAVLTESDSIKKKGRMQALIDRIEVRNPNDVTVYYRG